MLICVLDFNVVSNSMHVRSELQDNTSNETETDILALHVPQGLGGSSNAIASPPNMQLTLREQRGKAALVASIVGLTHMHSE